MTGLIITYGSGLTYGSGYTYGELFEISLAVESLLAKAGRYYEPINAGTLKVAALQWLENEPAALLPEALQWLVMEEDKEQHLPQQEYN